MNTGALIRCENENVGFASGTLDPNEAFFQDHFPEFPVLPGVLMIEILRAAAEALLRKQNPKRQCRLLEIGNVRYAQFLKPGETWEARVEKTGENAGTTDWKAQLLKEGRAVCSASFKLEDQ